MKKLKNHKHIYHHDSRHRAGFTVRIRVTGEDINKHFANNIYGGEYQALKAAVEWRDKQWNKNNIITHRSGLPQVNRITIKDKSGNTTAHWRCRWEEVDKGKRYSRSFAEMKYGEREAKKKAEDHAMIVFDKFYKY